MISTSPVVFKPRPSSGWLWLGLTTALMLALGLQSLLMEPRDLALAILFFGLAAYFALLAVLYPSMRYELTDRALVLRYGPLINRAIPLAKIEAIHTRKVRLSVLSAARVPGLALFRVDCIDEGEVFMCASTVGAEVVLIEAGGKKYGVTPEDEVGLVSALRSRMPH